MLPNKINNKLLDDVPRDVDTEVKGESACVLSCTIILYLIAADDMLAQKRG